MAGGTLNRVTSRFRCSRLVATCAFVTLLAASESQQPAVRVEPRDALGPRAIETPTQNAVIRDYLQAWRSLDNAFQQNRPELLDSDFVGIAKEKLTRAIREQQQLGIHTLFEDQAHDVSLGFYSPEGLSVQLIDQADYHVQIVDHEKTLGTKHVRARYVVVLTPTEVQWKVRVLQAAPQQENTLDVQGNP